MGMSRPAPPLVITTLEKTQIFFFSLGQFAKRDVVHNTLLTLRPLQLNGGHLRRPECKVDLFSFFFSHLHQEGVLVAIELKKVIIQLCCNPLLVTSVKIPGR